MKLIVGLDSQLMKKNIANLTKENQNSPFLWIKGESNKNDKHNDNNNNDNNNNNNNNNNNDDRSKKKCSVVKEGLIKFITFSEI